MMFVLLSAYLLSGCKQGDYSKIELPETKEQESTLEIRIEAEPDDENNISDGTRQEEGGEITLLFGGDVLLSSHVLHAYESAGGIGGVLDSGYREVIGRADFFMVNEEFPFSDRGKQAEDKQYTFRLPPDKVRLFGEMEIDGVTLANNHALDFGQEALSDTCNVLDTAGILHTGAGENLESASYPVSVNLVGKQIAILGATRVIPEANWAAGKNHGGMLAAYDPRQLLERIHALRQGNDYVIVYLHWGIERKEQPEKYQRQLGQQCIDAGADLVIGAHPHVLQGIEYYKGKPIVYSLGNFVFGSSIPRTMLLKVTLSGAVDSGDERDMRLHVIPGTSSAGYTRMLDSEEKRQEAYQYLEGISFGVTIDENGEILETIRIQGEKGYGAENR